MNERIKTVLQELGWEISEFQDNTVKLSKSVPFGRDFRIYTTNSRLYDDILSVKDEFDEEEYVKHELSLREMGMVDIPSEKELTDNAHNISIMINDLVDKIDNNPQFDDTQISYAREEIKYALQTIVNSELVIYNRISINTKKYIVKQGFYLDGDIVKERKN